MADIHNSIHVRCSSRLSHLLVGCIIPTRNNDTRAPKMAVGRIRWFRFEPSITRLCAVPNPVGTLAGKHFFPYCKQLLMDPNSSRRNITSSLDWQCDARTIGLRGISRQCRRFRFDDYRGVHDIDSVYTKRFDNMVCKIPMERLETLE